MAESRAFFDRPKEPRVGFELSVPRFERASNRARQEFCTIRLILRQNAKIPRLKTVANLARNREIKCIVLQPATDGENHKLGYPISILASRRHERNDATRSSMLWSLHRLRQP